MTDDSPLTDNDRLRLAAIYRSLLGELESLGGFRLPSREYDEAIKMVEGAFTEAAPIILAACEREKK
jgi:hypothetical protein